MDDERKKAIVQIGKVMGRYVPPPDRGSEATDAATTAHTNKLLQRAARGDIGPVGGWWEKKKEVAAKGVLDARAETLRAMGTVTREMTNLTFDTMNLRAAQAQFAAQTFTLGHELANSVAAREHAIALDSVRRAAELDTEQRIALEAQQFHEARRLTYNKNLELTAARKDAAVVDAQIDLEDAKRDQAKSPAPTAPPQAAPAGDVLGQLRDAYATAVAKGDHTEAGRLQQAIAAYSTPTVVPKAAAGS